MTHLFPATLRFLVTTLLALAMDLAQAAPPSTINYQGYLTNAGGTPVTNPAVAMSFSLFTAPSGGSALWSETQSVGVTGGVFNVVLGTGSLVGGSPLGSLAFDVPYYLEITAGGEMLSPRTALTSSPYAFSAATLAPGAVVGGAVPPGYMILGATDVPPPGFDLVGPLSGYYLFVRQGGQAIVRSTPTLGVAEGGTNSFGVNLAAMPASTVTVNVASNNTAAATVSPSILTFTTVDYPTPKNVTVTGVQDGNTVDESVTVTLSATGIASSTVTVNVTDDDTQGIVVSPTTLGVVEGGTNTFGVNLAFMPASTVTVNVASNNPGAATVSPSILTFTTVDYGPTPQNVTVTGVQDVNLVADSTTINLTSVGIPSNSVTVNVTDDDTQAILRSTPTLGVAEGGTNTFGVSLAYMPPSTTTVNVASGNTAAATVSPSSHSFTTADYSTPKNVTVTGVQDANNTNESVTVTLSSAGLASTTVGVTVVDDDLIIESLGWPSAFGGSQSISSGAVLAYLVNVPVATTVDKFGLIAAAGGADFRMALYADAAGAPGTLEHLMPARQTISAAGVQENNITDGAVSAGNHWLAIRVSPAASINYNAATMTSRCLRNVSIPSLDDPWPATYGASTCATAGTYNLYMVTYR